MESRIFVLFLVAGFVLATLTGCGTNRVVSQNDEQPAVIEPEVERRDIRIADIDTENFEVGAFIGQMSVEDFGVNTVVGARLAYHLTEDFFTEVSIGRVDTEETSFERLSGAAQLLTDADRELTYYNVSLGYNILPGESFFGENRALNTSLYVIGGVGRTNFAGDDRFTLNLGLGLRVMPRDWFAIHADIRDHIFDIDLLGQEKTSHNFEAHFGATFFF
jgi:outer membrane beta-barrel protein